MNEQMDKIRAWIVNNYFTPNVKAETILDTLLNDYVTEILKDQAAFKGELYFIAKEMSVLESGKGSEYGNRGTKIDYVLGDEERVYLVELKTTDSSIRWEQARRYLKNCHGKTFGEVFGDKLLSVMEGAFGKTYKDKVHRLPEPDKGDNPRRELEVLRKAILSVFEIWCPGEGDNKPSRPYAEAARNLIRAKGWAQLDSARSRKYLYTAGQLLDYLEDSRHRGRTLWDKPLRLIYLTPTGKCPWKKFRKEAYKDFCVGSFSLVRAGEYLKTKREDELALLLSQVIEDIYQ